MTRVQEKLTVEDVSLTWDGQTICEGITFSVEPGELVCLVGRSGTGKTTLFHAIAGLTVPQSGSIMLGDRNITGQPGHVSYMLQKDLLLDEHTIVDNISMPLRISGMPKAAARQAASAKLADFGLSGTEHLYPAQLSGGMRQRAALLRTYLMDNPVLLMDEPFSALDAFTRREMQEWFLKMLAQMGMSSLFVTHDVDEAVAIGDRILVLGPHCEGAPSTILASIPVDAAREGRAGFMLGEKAAAIRQNVLSLLI